jgi:hypothetical protein
MAWLSQAQVDLDEDDCALSQTKKLYISSQHTLLPCDDTGWGLTEAAVSTWSSRLKGPLNVYLMEIRMK